ncbi:MULTISPECIES: Abi family protein [Cyanophyceae]|uniref:Abi family protein n=1 Tax=Cyanophyceae TaxID=3028117 RepID=UPI00016DCE5E|nr:MULTISPECIES: Abi family protein [Cyanophyceae]ACB00926.1 conserved hypothetical protein, unknown function (DUF1526) [Picosynechococcus sp. PCC 7002]SMH58071.1 Abi-like protein [Picosynechococcus sp. OG1]SMQ86469.1 Abi-like protein [Synechococcus sp. 7002]
MQLQRPSYNKFAHFQEAISSNRLEAYRSASSDNEYHLLANYLWNISLCESLYPALHAFEIALRNSMNEAISRLFYKDWLHKKYSKILDNKESKIIEDAFRRLEKEKKIASTSNLISTLTLGFWVSLSYSRYEDANKLYPKLFRDSDFLPHLPKSKRTRKIICKSFTSIRKLRNKIFHHDPIWKDRNLQAEYDNILEAIQWMSPVLYETTKELSRFPDIYIEERIKYQEILKKTILNESETMSLKKFDDFITNRQGQIKTIKIRGKKIQYENCRLID